MNNIRKVKKHAYLTTAKSIVSKKKILEIGSLFLPKKFLTPVQSPQKQARKYKISHNSLWREQ